MELKHIIIIFIIILFFHLSYCSNVKENFNTNVNVDIEAINNLDSIAKLLTTDGFTIPGNLVTQTITANSSNLTPPGIIMAYTGTSPPPGWALCDGNNGTPNLVDRFIIGASRNFAFGQNYGNINATATLERKHIPPHTHTFGIPSNECPDIPGSNNNGTYDIDYLCISGDGTDKEGNRTSNNSCNQYSNALPVGNSSKRADPFSILPPYYAFCYIIKL